MEGMCYLLLAIVYVALLLFPIGWYGWPWTKKQQVTPHKHKPLELVVPWVIFLVVALI